MIHDSSNEHTTSKKKDIVTPAQLSAEHTMEKGEIEN